MMKRQRGVSYLEVMLALLVFCVCVSPAMDAMTTALVTIPAAAARGGEFACVRDQMEKVLAEPYATLVLHAAAAGAGTTPVPAYSLAADAACPARDAYLVPYDPGSSSPFVTVDSGLLLVRVAVPDGTTSLASLVARP
jgi:Tfp pilus assembly protein PilV